MLTQAGFTTIDRHFVRHIPQGPHYLAVAHKANRLASWPCGSNVGIRPDQRAKDRCWCRGVLPLYRRRDELAQEILRSRSSPLRKGPHADFSICLRCSSSHRRRRACLSGGRPKTKRTKVNVSNISKYPPA